MIIVELPGRAAVVHPASPNKAMDLPALSRRQVIAEPFIDAVEAEVVVRGGCAKTRPMQGGGCDGSGAASGRMRSGGRR